MKTRIHKDNQICLKARHSNTVIDRQKYNKNNVQINKFILIVTNNPYINSYANLQLQRLTRDKIQMNNHYTKVENI